MSNSQKRSRSNKYEKRRRNNKAISILLIVAIVLTVLLIFVLLFGGSDKSEDKVEDKPVGQLTFTEDNKNDDEATDEVDTEQEDKELNEDDDDNHDNSEIKVTEIDSTDANVIEAYTGNWEALGTEQTGPHTTSYTKGSPDRVEISEAVLFVTGLNANDYVEHWIGNGGDQKVIATVSNTEQTEIYRVYLTWIDEKGWQPTQVEKLSKVSKSN